MPCWLQQAVDSLCVQSLDCPRSHVPAPFNVPFLHGDVRKQEVSAVPSPNEQFPG